MNPLIKNILSDLRVELLDEFDQNFTRKAFFDRPWPQRKTETGRGTLMMVTGRMRRSLRCHSTHLRLVFSSDTPYFGIHNRGGKIKVTPQMRKYFWAMYYQSIQRVTPSVKTRTITGKQNHTLNKRAESYRAMALTKHTHITIPERRVVGDHPKVRQIVERTARSNIEAWARANLEPALKQIGKL